jgi:hypothetical protein
VFAYSSETNTLPHAQSSDTQLQYCVIGGTTVRRHSCIFIFLIMYLMLAIHVVRTSQSSVRSRTTFGGERLCSGAAGLTGNRAPKALSENVLYMGVSPSATRLVSFYDSFLADGGP